MSSKQLAAKATTYLDKLCVEIDNRCVGSKGNQAATDFFASTVETFGFKIDTPTFACMDWSEDGADLRINGISYEAFVSPYSRQGDVRAPMMVVETVSDLEITDLKDKVVLLHKDIAQEQLMPKNFPFYNPEEHQHIIRLLEQKRPLAIITATAKNPAVAGGVYPFPLIEDGDFEIPSVYMTDVAGERLAQHDGEIVSLTIRANSKPSSGCNVIASKGNNPNRRIVVCAHIDAKMGTPGALDNGTGITTLLLLAELLKDYQGDTTIEIVAINGEDYYSAIGEIEYLKQNEGRFDNILLAINMDGLGYKEGKTSYSLYNCPASIEEAVRATCLEYEDMSEGPQWYQSDHSLFVMNQRPAIALTSNAFDDLWSHIAHTKKDRPELVDTMKLVSAATVLHDLLLNLDQPN